MMRPLYYDESNSDVVPDLTQHQWSLWAQDSWKATRKLTLNIGLRADHQGQWYDKIGGTQVWDSARYVNTPKPPANTGLLWHQIDPKIPSSGWKSDLFFYNPRLGAAYDAFGTGKTVVRAGFGTYRYQVSFERRRRSNRWPLGSFDFDRFSRYSQLLRRSIQGGVIGQVTRRLNLDSRHTNSLLIPKGSDQWQRLATDEGDDKVPYANLCRLGRLAQAFTRHTVPRIGSKHDRDQLLNGADRREPDSVSAPFYSTGSDGNYDDTAPIAAAAQVPTISTQLIDYRTSDPDASSLHELQLVPGLGTSMQATLPVHPFIGKVLGAREGSQNGAMIRSFMTRTTVRAAGTEPYQGLHSFVTDCPRRFTATCSWVELINELAASRTTRHMKINTPTSPTHQA